MRIISIIVFLFTFSIIKSQSIELLKFNIQRSYEKNCDSIANCVDSLSYTENILSFNFHLKDNLIYNPERSLSYKLRRDTLIIDYYSKPFEKDSIVLNPTTKEFDTLKIIMQSVSFYDILHSGCKKYHFEFANLIKKPQIVFNNKLVAFCPTSDISFSIYKDIKINIINNNGYKEGKWIEFYDTGEIQKVKEYKNGRFLEGYMYNKSGKISHVVSEEEQEIAIPIDVYNATHQ